MQRANFLVDNSIVETNSFLYTSLYLLSSKCAVDGTRSALIQERNTFCSYINSFSHLFHRVI